MAYLALYRKYRPSTFSEVVGQEHIIKTLKGALILGKISHAYLFCGPRGVGKTTVARLLAKAVNCLAEKKDERPCNKCEICKAINEGRLVDLVEIDAASNRGINEIKELREEIKFTPTQARFKVFIIDEVHMLTIEAFNALLKTLEEPPSHAIFILATTQPHKIPPTILSRCQRFDFRKLTQEELVAHLENIVKKENLEAEKKALELIAQLAEGSGRDALSILGQVIALEDKKITLEEVKTILGISDFSSIIQLADFLIAKDSPSAINLVNEILEGGYDLYQFTKSFLEYLRKLLLIKVSPNLAHLTEVDLTKEQLAKATAQAEKVSLNFLIKLIKLFIRASEEVKSSFLPQMPLEIAIIEGVGTLKESYQNNGGSSNDKRSFNNGKNKLKTTKQELALEPKGTKNASSLKMIQDNWQNILSEARKRNFSLGIFLRSCQPYRLDNNHLTLISQYNFHKEKIEELKNRRLIEEILEKFFASKFQVSCVLANGGFSSNPEKIDSAKNQHQKSSLNFSNDLIKTALEVFDGKLEK